MHTEYPKIDIFLPLAGQGGAEMVINKVAVYLLKCGYQIRVVQWTYIDFPWLDEAVPYYPLLRGKRVKTMYDAVPLYVSFLKEHGLPDMIIATPWPYVSVVAREAMNKMNAPCRIISWMHGPLEECIRRDLGGYGALSYADCHFVLNQKEINGIRCNLPDAKAEVVRNPIDFSKCVYREQQPGALDTLFFVGRLSKEKRVHLILEWMAQAETSWKLRIVGDGSEGKALQKKAGDLGLQEQVEFLGWQEHPWEHTQDVAALVLASEYETGPMVAFEALACGIPVISTPVGMCPELIQPGVNGFLYSPGEGLELPQILDLYGNHQFPEILPANCRASVIEYEESAALQDFQEKVQAVWEA